MARIELTLESRTEISQLVGAEDERHLVGVSEAKQISLIGN
jgi:hypothetical protein